MPAFTNEFAIKSVVGMPREAAAQLLEKNDLIARVVAVDGFQLPVPFDFNKHRINLRIKDGLVVEAFEG